MVSPFGSGPFGGQFSAPLNSATSKLIDHCLIAVGVNTEDDAYRERTLTFLNFVYLNRLKGRHWKFTHRELFIDLRAPYDTGTVALTSGSDIVQEDTSPPALSWNSTLLGQMFCPTQNDQDFYRIRKIETSKKLLLSSGYSGDTAAGSEYEILFDRVILEPGVQAVKSAVIGGVGKIIPCGTQEFRNRKAMNPCLTGQPKWFTLVHAEEDSGQWTLELYPAPDKRYAVQIDYNVRPVGLEDSESSFSLIPPEHMDVLYYGVLAELYRYQENGAMVDQVSKLAANSWLRFASDQEMTDSVARVQHHRNYFTRSRGRYRGYFGLKWFGKVED